VTSSTAETGVVPARRGGVARFVRRHGWTVGIYVLLLVLTLFWRSQTTVKWGPFDVQSLVIDALPLCFAACAQSIVIISGGIDLSVGSMMSLANVVSSTYSGNRQVSARRVARYAAASRPTTKRLHRAGSRSRAKSHQRPHIMRGAATMDHGN